MLSNDSGTLSAHDETTGREMHFTDYVQADDVVELWRDPETERGYRGLRVVYRDGHGDWYLRALTDVERVERTERILARMPTLPGERP